MAKRQEPTSQTRPLDSKLFRIILITGLGLRCLVFAFLDPVNPDTRAHILHAVYIRDEHSIPRAGEGDETWQPPLYYIAVAGLGEVTLDKKAVQAISLAASLAALWIAMKLIEGDALFATKPGKYLAALLVAFLPQFVMFGLYISNDSLATTLGFLSLFLLVRLADKPTIARFIACAAALACGLLTKGQFLAITIVMFPIALFLYWKAAASRPAAAGAATALAIVLLGIGCFKYIQNAVYFGHPFLMNLDFHPVWESAQQDTFRSFGEAINLNLAGLLRDPIWTEPTSHSVTTMLYGTFWYQYIPESNFHGNLMPAAQWIGRYMDAIGIVPTILLLIGVLASPFWIGLMRGSKIAKPIQFAAVAAFAGNLLMMILQFARFDVWSIIQARSLFPTLLGALVLCDLGIAAIAKVTAPSKLNRGTLAWGIAFVAGSLVYFATEISLVLNHPSM